MAYLKLTSQASVPATLDHRAVILVDNRIYIGDSSNNPQPLGLVESINALGSISGTNDIDTSLGSIVTATLTAATTLTFSGEPGSGERSFVLKFSGAETINWPANTIFAGGAAPSITGPDYEIPCSIDSSGVVTVHGIIDEYATV